VTERKRKRHLKEKFDGIRGQGIKNRNEIPHDPVSKDLHQGELNHGKKHRRGPPVRKLPKHHREPWKPPDVLLKIPEVDRGQEESNLQFGKKNFYKKVEGPIGHELSLFGKPKGVV